MEFVPFQKISRLSREIVVTEKIDGTNAQITIAPVAGAAGAIATLGDLGLWAGSRSKWLQPGKSTDNFGFAAWALENAVELFRLGEGTHFGEWWGSGIQRGYGLEKGEKRFSLFNTSRWDDAASRPACCSVVPTLYAGPFSTNQIDEEVAALAFYGSQAAIGFMKPEGVVVFHAHSRTLFKKTIEKDAEPKSHQAAA